MERFFRLGNLGGLGGNFNPGGAAPSDSNQVDTSETVYISSLALLKMLKHGRAGVPMEVGDNFKTFYVTSCNYRSWVLCSANLSMNTQ